MSKYGEEPTQFAALGYDAVYAIYEAMNEAVENGNKITSKTSPSELCDMLAEVFENGYSFDGVTGEDITWEDGYVNKAPVVVCIN